jgi:translocation and assembly module TamB
VADGDVRLAEFVWDNGRITTSGNFHAVPLATVTRLAGAPLPFGSTVTLGGEWSLAAAPRLTGNLTVRREAGDVFFVRDAAPETRIAAGITALTAVARFTDGAIDATASLRSARGDAADAKLAIGTVAGAPDGRIARDAPLEFSLTGDMPSLQILQPWIGSAAVVSGRAHLDIAARGTVGRAVLSGALKGEGLRLDAPQHGLHFTDGRIAAHAADGRVVIDEVVLGAGAGTFRASGEITGLAAGGERPVARLAWRAEKFRAFNRPDLRLVVGGEGTAVAEGGRITISGKLRADEGRIVYLATSDAALGDDVIVKGWTRPATERMRAQDVPLTVDLTLDLGDRLTFSGEGIETGLSGVVQVTTGPRGLLGRGTIRTVRGTYFAFGQQLTIDRGQLVFDGPLDNPGLDIVALRKNLAVEAGVTITGTVKVPVIQLTSNPPVPDSEKLSWLVLGQALDGSSGGDLAALQAASAVLLGPRGKPVSATIAQRIGLDDISVRSASATAGRAQPGTTGAEGQVVAVGKRLTDRLSLVYEQGLSLANNTLRLEYELTRSLRLRAEAGTISGIGIFFRRSFD